MKPNPKYRPAQVGDFLGFRINLETLKKQYMYQTASGPEWFDSPKKVLKWKVAKPA